MKKYGLTALMQLAKGLCKKAHDRFALNLTALKEAVNWAYQMMLADIPSEFSPVKALINLWRGRRNRNAPAILRELLARDCPVVIVNTHFYDGFPRLALAEYKAASVSSQACIIRINPAATGAILEWHGIEAMPFDLHGTVVVPRRDDQIPALTATNILGRLCADGWWLLTVENAAAILAGLEPAGVDHLFLTKMDRWLTPVEEIAHFARFPVKLFATCERVVSSGMPMIVVYTPWLPWAFRLQAISLSTIMAPAPSID